jgi:hypothetical protein
MQRYTIDKHIKERLRGLGPLGEIQGQEEEVENLNPQINKKSQTGFTN